LEETIFGKVTASLGSVSCRPSLALLLLLVELGDVKGFVDVLEMETSDCLIRDQVQDG
jgi:hypothetical protein